MMRRIALPLALASLLIGCSSTPRSIPPEQFDATLDAPVERVKDAVTKVLVNDGYDVVWEDEQTLKTGYRAKYSGPWNWLLHCCFGTLKSRVEATVSPATDQTTRVRLQVLAEGKDGLFTAWEDVQSALPQSADNQLRLIKNELRIL